MLRKLLVGLLLLLAAQLGPAYSGSVIDDNSVISTGASGGNQPGGGCAQATTFLARTSGMPGSYQTAYATMICGMVTDGTITGNMGTTGCGSIFDVLYIFASDSQSNAVLNLCGTSFTATVNGTVSFSAHEGLIGPGSGAGNFVDTGYQPSTAGSTCGNGSLACNYVLNSASIASYGLTSRTTSNATIIIGVAVGTATSQIVPYLSGGGQEINGNAGLVETVSNANGLSILTRTASNAFAYYHYNSTATPTTSSQNFASTSLPAGKIYITARNNSGTADSFSVERCAAAFIGSGMTQATADKISTRINQYMIDVGASYHY